MENYKQLSLFQDPARDVRAPVTVTWNAIHGCSKVSPGCLHCYMFRKDEAVGRDPTVVHKTRNFNLPVRKLRTGAYKDLYKVPSGSHFYTCFSSDFFHIDADEWRKDLWNMMRERSDCTFFMITKRPERIRENLPYDWGGGWDHVDIAVTCESQEMADMRLPVYLPLPLKHRSVMIEPMLSPVDLSCYFEDYPGMIESVSVGGESGPDARPCDFDWILNVHRQCRKYGSGFYYHQTGAKLIKDGKLYNIPRKLQHEQAAKAGLDL